MNVWFVTWQALRLARWLLWLAFLGYTGYVTMNRADFVSSFGHLLPQFELPIFGLAIGAVTAGLLELMAREKAGYMRPSLRQLLPPRA